MSLCKKAQFIEKKILISILVFFLYIILINKFIVVLEKLLQEPSCAIRYKKNCTRRRRVYMNSPNLFEHKLLPLPEHTFIATIVRLFLAHQLN